MTEQNLNPDRIEWNRDGYTIWADEDGAHFKTFGARAFEMPEAIAMVDLYQAVLAQFRSGEPFAKPTPPTREQRMFFYPERYTARRVRQAVGKAIDDEFNLNPTDIPF